MDEKNKKTSLISPAGIGDIVKREKSKDFAIESFWALLKRGYHGTYHHMSEKHLDRSSANSPAAITTAVPIQ